MAVRASIIFLRKRLARKGENFLPSRPTSALARRFRRVADHRWVLVATTYARGEHGGLLVPHEIPGRDATSTHVIEMFAPHGDDGWRAVKPILDIRDVSALAHRSTYSTYRDVEAGHYQSAYNVGSRICFNTDDFYTLDYERRDSLPTRLPGGSGRAGRHAMLCPLPGEHWGRCCIDRAQPERSGWTPQPRRLTLIEARLRRQTQDPKELRALMDEYAAEIRAQRRARQFAPDKSIKR